MSTPRWVVAALVVAPFGVAGAILLIVLTARPWESIGVFLWTSSFWVFGMTLNWLQRLRQQAQRGPQS